MLLFPLTKINRYFFPASGNPQFPQKVFPILLIFVEIKDNAHQE